jgi:hypothetical protein
VERTENQNNEHLNVLESWINLHQRFGTVLEIYGASCHWVHIVFRQTIGLGRKQWTIQLNILQWMDPQPTYTQLSTSLFTVRIILPFHRTASDTMAFWIIFQESGQCHSADTIFSCTFTLVYLFYDSLLQRLAWECSGNHITYHYNRLWHIMIAGNWTGVTYDNPTERLHSTGTW